jgi:hypothetical protein
MRRITTLGIWWDYEIFDYFHTSHGILDFGLPGQSSG